MVIKAWYMDSEEAVDQREPHVLSSAPLVTLETLENLGILHWSNLVDENDATLVEVRATRGYNFTDTISVCPEKLPNYEDKIRSFYREHIHYDEEIRFCLDGTGYFDIRDGSNMWIRISVEAGDMIILPEGIYHRFTCDSNNYIKAMRLFVGEPVWTPYNRDEIEEQTNASRLKYIQKFLSA